MVEESDKNGALNTLLRFERFVYTLSELHDS